MPTPSLITELSTTAASNYPAGSDSPNVLDDVQRAHAAFIAQLRDDPSANATTAIPVAKGGTGSTTAAAARTALSVAPRATRIDVASVAGTVDLTTSAPDTDDIRITGALAITAFTVAVGRVIRVTASGASTLTNNANIVTNTGANIVCAAGDTYSLRATAANTVEVLNFVAAASLTVPLPLARGGTNSTVTRQIRQTVTATRTTVGTGTTQIPSTDTIPTITQGDEYLTVSITPFSASSTLKIRASCTGTHSVAGVSLAMCLFQDAVSNSLAVGWATVPTIAYNVPLHVDHEMTSGTTSAITFRIRVGGDAAGTTTVNGATGTRRYGGVGVMRITVEEILP